MKKILQIALSTALAAALTAPMFAQAPAAAPPAKTTTKAAKAAKPAPSAPTAAEIADAKSKGLVWANLNTKVYHTDGKFYGTTKNGKFMTKDDATKAGFKPAQEPTAKKAKTAEKPADKK
jgi:hypothetical protein